MRFYAGQHQYSVGIDLHARRMYVCVLDAAGEVQMHRNITASPTGLGRVISRFGPDLVIAVECIFAWYRIADYCAKRKRYPPAQPRNGNRRRDLTKAQHVPRFTGL